MKKLFKIFPLIFAAALLFCSCGAMAHIADTNGDEDFSLCEITDEQLTAKDPQYVRELSSITQNNNTIKFSVKKMSGVDIVYSFKADNKHTYSVTVTPSLTSGNLYLYWYHDGEIVQKAAVDEAGVYSACFDESGIYQLRAAAESAEFSVEIVFDEA